MFPSPSWFSNIVDATRIDLGEWLIAATDGGLAISGEGDRCGHGLQCYRHLAVWLLIIEQAT